MNYTIIDIEKYYRKEVYKFFTQNSKSSFSITNKLNVSALQKYSKRTNTKFYINFLYCLARVINSRDDYKMGYLWETNETVVFDKMNITHYTFFKETETCTPVYTEYVEDYKTFYQGCYNDIEKAKQSRTSHSDNENHLNYFEASYISWISYESLHVELPDGYLYYQPIINWGKYKEENGQLMMPVTVRMNHAVADGYLVAKVFLLLENEIEKLVSNE